MKFQQPPLKIDCTNLSDSTIAELADRLSFHFEHVKIFGSDIYASKPLSYHNYAIAWLILDRFNVKAN